ncbi:MAG: magnesium transporter CorA family protein [Solirubrobacterales bacterium]
MGEGQHDDGTPRGGCTVLHKTGLNRLPELIGRGEYLWLDLHDADDEEIATAGEQLKLHPLTIEDLQHFGQRAKIEEYSDYVYLVSYGAAPQSDEDRLVEVHIIYSDRFLITVSRDRSSELRGFHEASRVTEFTGIQLLHQVLDVLVDSFGPLLDDIDDQIEILEDQVFERSLSGREREIHEARRMLGRINRVVHRQSEAYTRLHEMLGRLPNHSREHLPYFRDVQDHLIRVTEAADSLRDRVSGLSETYMAALDMRQNAIMKEFTVIAGIFLPLTVVVGYFGQNFRWMTDHVAGWISFGIYGVILPMVILGGLLYTFRRRGLLGD